MTGSMNVYMGARGKRIVYAAMAEGLGCPLIEPEVHERRRLLPGGFAMYGSIHLWDIFMLARRDGRDWIYADNGYLRPGHWDGYFSVTRRGYQWDGTGEGSEDRFAALDIVIQPWRTGGRHVLVCPPTPIWSTLIGLDDGRWVRDTVAALKAATDRPIRIRRKPRKRSGDVPAVPFAEDLKNCWAVVTHSTKAAVEALMAGVPVFCTAPCAASRLALADLAEIERPFRPNRWDWACGLAANQWTIEEMRRGLFRERLGIEAK